MGDNSLINVKVEPKHLDDYQQFTTEVNKKIKSLAENLAGLSVAHLNATAVGGGVAEMLKSVVPLQRDIGLDSQWYILPPDDAFFEVTKQLHNFLQGKEGELSLDDLQIYENYNKYIAKLIDEIETDILIIHDPQPAAALTYLKNDKPELTIWRCHIDTSHPNKKVWETFENYWKPYDHYVFTMEEYAHEFFPKDRLSLITPVIDPLSAKNKAMDVAEARMYLKQFDFDANTPFVTQVSRFDPWKDPLGVIDAFEIAKKEIPDLQLVLAAQMADDDPEGAVIYKKVKEYAEGKEGVHLIVNFPDNELFVNALQVSSTAILQKSIREGFGLTVTEAMWKTNAVIGGNVGGIKLQIEDGVSGFLVNSPMEAAEKIVYLCKNPHEKEKIAKAAHESVKKRFLMPHMILNYLNIFDDYFG